MLMKAIQVVPWLEEDEFLLSACETSVEHLINLLGGKRPDDQSLESDKSDTSA